MMRKDGNLFTSVSEKHSLLILTGLREMDRPVMITEITDLVHNQTLRMMVDDMEEDGLVDIEVVISDRKRVMVSLTDLGRDVALMLSMVNVAVAPGKDIVEKSVDMKYADPILRILRARGPVIASNITKLIPSNITVSKLLTVMEEDGLVKKETPPGKVRPLRFILTPLGVQIADIYQSIYEKITK